MKKKFLVAAAILTFALCASACSGNSKGTTASTAATEQVQTTKADAAETQIGADTAEAQTGASPSTDGNDSAKDTQTPASEGTLNGKVDVNKGFMITVISDEDSEAYVFSLDEEQGKTYETLKSGDKVVVSYTNGLPSPDNMETVVVDIKTAK